MTIAERMPRVRTDSVFYPLMAVAMTVVVFAGFAPSFYMKSVYNAPPELSTLMIVHGAVFTTWMAILIAQTTLVAGNRRDLHRTLGIAGFIVAGLMLVLGTMLAVDALRRGFSPIAAVPPAVFFVIPIGNILVFIGILVLGWINRARSDYHKHYMLLATAALLVPAIARILQHGFNAPNIVIAFALSDLVVVAMAIYDFAIRGKVHPATIRAGLILIASGPILLAIGGTPAWHSFAMSLT
ncbi:MAG TPA: hypothetical protein VII39_06805 [Bradyrhizobium sp.]|jgi:uncharacterized membrane protein